MHPNCVLSGLRSFVIAVATAAAGLMVLAGTVNVALIEGAWQDSLARREGG